jgi:hypothetical protein
VTAVHHAPGDYPDGKQGQGNMSRHCFSTVLSEVQSDLTGAERPNEPIIDQRCSNCLGIGLSNLAIVFRASENCEVL